MKNGKATGPDESCAELVKILDDEGKCMLVDLLNEMYNAESLDDERTKARVCSLYKKGTPKDLGNYRYLS
eukprot:7490594-Karenia_brevis.AAC.1